jgi:hypothetical protein
VSFEDADMDLEEIILRRQKDCGGEWQKFPTNVVEQAAGRIRGVIDFQVTALTNCSPGNYPYEVWAEDATNRVSNVLTLQFVVE